MLPERIDVLIVGAGPAGLAAALELKRLGVASIAVTDREPEAGGTPRLCHHPGFGWDDLRRLVSGPGYARLYRQAAADAGIAVHTNTTITHWDDAGALGYTGPAGLGTVQARAVLLATGCRERPRSARLVPGKRPMGVLTTGSLQRFLYEQRLPVGRRAVIVGAELVSLSALLSLWEAHIPAAAMVTELPAPQIYFPYQPMQWLLAGLLARTPIRTGARATAIVGRRRVEGVEISETATGRTETLACDTVVFTGDWIPEHELARLGGLAIDPGTRGPRIDGEFRTSRPGVFAAGNLLRGAETASTAALEGRRAAAGIRRYLDSESWPERELSIEVEAPLTWICPNQVSGMGASLSGFGFRSAIFCDNVRIEVWQGSRQLYAAPPVRLRVNDTMHLSGGWLPQAEPGAGPLRVKAILPAGRS